MKKLHEDGPPTVLFDLDGTLMHTAPALAVALNTVLRRHSGRSVTAEETSAMIGGGLFSLFETARIAQGIDLSPSQAAAEYERFLEYYRADPTVSSNLYPGMLDLLRQLLRDGYRLAVCTNKNEAIAIDILDRIGVASLFGVILGDDGKRAKKPDPAPLLEAIAALGGDPAAAIMIGDSSVDVGAARAAGIPVVLVTFGYSNQPVDTLGADGVVTDAIGIQRAIAEMRLRG